MRSGTTSRYGSSERACECSRTFVAAVFGDCYHSDDVPQVGAIFLQMMLLFICTYRTYLNFCCLRHREHRLWTTHIFKRSFFFSQNHLIFGNRAYNRPSSNDESISGGKVLAAGLEKNVRFVGNSWDDCVPILQIDGTGCYYSYIQRRKQEPYSSNTKTNTNIQKEVQKSKIRKHQDIQYELDSVLLYNRERNLELVNEYQQ